MYNNIIINDYDYLIDKLDLSFLNTVNYGLIGLFISLFALVLAIRENRKSRTITKNQLLCIVYLQKILKGTLAGITSTNNESSNGTNHKLIVLTQMLLGNTDKVKSEFLEKLEKIRETYNKRADQDRKNIINDQQLTFDYVYGTLEFDEESGINTVLKDVKEDEHGNLYRVDQDGNILEKQIYARKGEENK